MNYEIDSRGVKIKCRRCGGWHYYDDSMGIDLIALCMDCIAKEAVAAARSEKDAREQHDRQAVRSSAWLECASWLEEQARKVSESIRPLWPATDKARLEREAARIEGWASELRAHSNYVFGMVKPKPITGLPQGIRVRLRQRAGSFATVYLRMPDGVVERYLKDRGATWELAEPIGINRTVQ